MRIAVSYENGNVSGQFVQTESFKLYDIVSNEVVFSQTVSPSGKGHNALAGFLADQLVTCLICGEIGPDGQPPWRTGASSSTPAAPAMPTRRSLSCWPGP